MTSTWMLSLRGNPPSVRPPGRVMTARIFIYLSPWAAPSPTILKNHPAFATASSSRFVV
jgi:hypothetical protein